jgi:hypothetical protein
MSLQCSICEGLLRPFLERPNVPVHPNFACDSEEDARNVLRGHLTLEACERCGFVTNTTFAPDLLDYGTTYDSDQSHSTFFQQYLDSLIDEILADGLRGREVLEIGCGKGHFLRRLCERGGNVGVGFDPSYVGPAQTLDGRMRFVRELFDRTLADAHPHAIVCRHVLELLPRPLDLLLSIRREIGEARDVKLYIETSELDWMAENALIRDFCYERCSYFSADTLTVALERAGFELLRKTHVFSGQYVWIVARTQQGAARPTKTAPPALSRAGDLNYEREQDELAAWTAKLNRLPRPIAVWGASAKGVTFLNLLDPRCAHVDCVVDINPGKQRRFLPGTGHPIVAPADLNERGVKSVVLMNPNYRSEVQGALSAVGLPPDLLVETAP